ncbi:MAG: outer membrane beta-barrel protein [Candidatus Aminicenantes bacterium]|nr:outer membrane beta-barrel protein [Candidatus Aminicenantes bacterium]
MKRTKLIFCRRALVLLAFFASSTLGFSQGYRSFRYEREEIIRTAPYKIGPFRLFASFGLRDIGYDSNVYYEREDQGPTSDYTYAASLAVEMYYLFHNSVIISLRENPEYVHYFEQKRERGWNNIFAPEIRVLLFNQFVLNGGYLNSKRRYRATSEFNSRVDEYREGFSGGLFYETARGTSLGISGSSTEISYGDVQGVPAFSSLNRKELEGNLEVYYPLTSETYLFMRGGYSEYDFVEPLYKWRDAFSYQVYSGIRFPLLGMIRGILSLGFKNLVPRRSGLKEFSGLVGNTSLDIRLLRFGFRFGFIRDSYFSYWSDSRYFIQNQWRAGVSFYPTRFLRIDYDFNTGRDSYPEDVTVVSPDGGLEQIKRYNRFRSHVAGVVVRIIRNTGLGVAVSYWDRESNAYLQNRERFSWGGFLTYDF